MNLINWCPNNVGPRRGGKVQGGCYMSSLLNVSQVFAILLVMPNILLGPQAAGTDPREVWDCSM